MSKTRQNGIAAIVLGLAVIGVGYWFYADLAALEVKGGSMRVHSLVKLLYEMGGKYAVLGVVGGAGALIASFGLRSLLKRETPAQVSS